MTYWCIKILIQLLQRKVFQLFFILVGKYLGHFTDSCVLRNPIRAVIINKNAYHLKMTGNYSGENLPLPEHKYIEILGRGGLWKVDDNMILISKVAKCHFKIITSVPTIKFDCKSIVSTLMKNPFIRESLSKLRIKSTDTITKKEIALNLLEELLTL